MLLMEINPRGAVADWVISLAVHPRLSGAFPAFRHVRRSSRARQWKFAWAAKAMRSVKWLFRLWMSCRAWSVWRPAIACAVFRPPRGGAVGGWRKMFFGRQAHRIGRMALPNKNTTCRRCCP